MFFCLMFSVNSGFSQEINETLDKKTRKKYEKKEKKRQKEEEQQKAKENLKTLLEEKRFVLEANNLSGRSGMQVPVSPTINFFAVDSTSAMLQVGSFRGLGYNGVGGITDEGKITRYEITETKGGFSVKIYVSSNLTSYTIFLSASPMASSTAKVSGLSGGVINFHGRIVPETDSSVYEGQKLY